LAKGRVNAPVLERYTVRFGETLDQIATARKTTAAKLIELNGIAPGEVVRGGAVLLVPKLDIAAGALPAAPAVAPKLTVVVPADVFVYPDRKRMFYRVVVGDTLREIAAQFRVPTDDVRRWNNLDPVARLIEGMTLQVFPAPGADLSRVVVLAESEVRVVAIGSDEFFAYLETQRGQKRIALVAHAGDTLESIGKKYQVPVKTMERINRKGRSETLKEGETVVVYVPGGAGLSGGPVASTAHGAPTPNGPLPNAPVPDLLP
jgi:membrane-bound lytic murein transglycosylase D